MTHSTQIKSLINKALSGLVVLMLVFALPSHVIAQEAASNSGDTSAPASTTVTEKSPEVVKPAETKATEPKTGPTKPTGDASKTYTENKDTGLWENDKYTWDPVTKQTKPKVAPNYSYNPATKMWDTTEYAYSPESGKYVPNVKSTSQPPAGSQAISGTGPNSNNQISGSNGTGGSNINGTGPNSTNTINNGGSTNGTFDLFFNGSISNNINSTATSGNASVQGNTRAGGALTGNADNLVNVVNMLQSSFLDSNSNMSSFVFNIDGNVYGDLFIDPSALPANYGNTNIDVNASNNAAINNNINVDSKSGDAKVANNTKGGSAQSGDANAVVNLINLINSSIMSGQSFTGVLNINGNLNGDILLPQYLLDALIALSGPGSNNQITGGGNTNIDVNSTANKTINNNIDANAKSGSATVSGNTSAGGATSGQANTSTETLNLIGQTISGKNGLLVFINVLGKWVGLSLTPNSSAAITNTGPDSNNTIKGGGDTSISVNAEENSLINNNVTANATSGNATVSGNTIAGDAKSGNANIAVNVLNLADTNLKVDDWFGALFINVFGSWEGSFGLDTAAGNQKAQSTNNNVSSAQNSSNSSGSAASKAKQVFGFVASGASSGSSRPATTVANNNSSAVVDTEVNAGSAVASASSPTDKGNQAAASASNNNKKTALALPAWSIAIAIILIPLVLFGDKLLPLIRSRFITAQ